MRLLDVVAGHQEVIEKILESFAQGRPGQTFLFVGPSGIGKRQTALGLAQALLCDVNRRACGQCGSCLRVARLQHEALSLVSPQGAQIKIEQAREVVETLNLRSLGENRVIILDQAQTLNPQAANSMLKILEEPPAGTFFFLIAPTPASLLSTLRSRSRIVAFRPLSEADMIRREDAPKWMIKSSAGSFEKLRLLQEPTEQELRAKAVELLQIFLKDADFLTNENWRGFLKERGQAGKYLTYWVSFMRDALFVLHGKADLITNLDQAALIKVLAAQGPERLLSLMQKCLATERSLLGHLDAVLLLEKMWVSEKAEGASYVD